MRSFTNQKAITAISRQTYVGDKSSFGSIGTADGYLRPLTEEQSSLNSLQFGQGFALFVEDKVDIQEKDKVTIDAVEYTVRGCAPHDRGSVPFKRCLIVKPQP